MAESVPKKPICVFEGCAFRPSEMISTLDADAAAAIILVMGVNFRVAQSVTDRNGTHHAD
jgi:hypothetical protein